jgi:hypothetical protein
MYNPVIKVPYTSIYKARVRGRKIRKVNLFRILALQKSGRE